MQLSALLRRPDPTQFLLMTIYGVVNTCQEPALFLSIPVTTSQEDRYHFPGEETEALRGRRMLKRPHDLNRHPVSIYFCINKFKLGFYRNRKGAVQCRRLAWQWWSAVGKTWPPSHKKGSHWVSEASGAGGLQLQCFLPCFCFCFLALSGWWYVGLGWLFLKLQMIFNEF